MLSITSRHIVEFTFILAAGPDSSAPSEKSDSVFVQQPLDVRALGDKPQFMENGRVPLSPENQV